MATINYIERHLKTFSVKPHKHNYWEIIYVTEGSGTITVENKYVINYKKGETVFIPPQMKHVNNSSVGFKNIHLTLENWLTTIKLPTLIPDTETSKDLLSLLKLAYKYFHKFPINNPINISLTNGIVALLDYLTANPEANNTTQIVAEYILNNFPETDLSLDNVYNLIPLSKEYIRKLFIKEYGISPLQFLNKQRIDFAKKLLSKSDYKHLRINEIAFNCGFEDAAYFSRLFKKETGFSPKSFNLQLLTDNKNFD